jgi:hypothetical protein
MFLPLTPGAILDELTKSPEFPDLNWKNKPCEWAIRRLIQKLNTHHTIDDRRENRKGNQTKFTKQTDRNANLIQKMQVEMKRIWGFKKHASNRYVSKRLKLSMFTVRKIRKNKLKMKFYRRQKGQKIPQRSVEKRLQFCEWSKQKFTFTDADGTQDTRKHVDWLIEYGAWGDETQVELTPHYNPKNMGEWATSLPGEENVHETVSKPLKKMAHVIVCKQLPGSGILVNWIDGKINGTKYKKLLQYKIFPQLRQKLGPEKFKKLWWIEDGAPPHWKHENSDYLDRTFAGKVIARDFLKWHPGCPGANWPSYSPDVTCLDYWANDHLKKLTWELERETGMIENLTDLRRNFEMAASMVTRDEMIRAVAALGDRLLMLEIKEGGRFERYKDKLKQILRKNN